MRKPLIVGNWKMHGSLNKNAELLAALVAELVQVPEVDCGVAVPGVYVPSVAASLVNTNVSVGGQDVSSYVSGAYTGEVAAEMLKDVGASFTLIGHSERRTYHGETNQQVLDKTKRVVSNGMTAIVCIGETLEEHLAGQTHEVLTSQLLLLCQNLTVEEWSRVVLAYEPVWAIGTGKVASPEYAQNAHEFIRKMVSSVDSTLSAKIKILYGGSVKSENAAQLRAMPDIDGALVGGASLVAEQFLGICRNFR